MTQIFGNFIEKPLTKEKLILEFLSDSISVQDFWRNNDYAANFIADFLTAFISKNGATSDSQRQAEAKSAASYIANELLENAVKYSHQASQIPIQIKLYLDKGKILFFIKNSLSHLRSANLQGVIYQLSNSNHEELYFNQLEKSIDDEYSFKSGLGFLSMINDYSAKVAWKFETVADKPAIMIVTTMVEFQM
ncbi:hypothetical protein NIES4071_98130 [Calothrix sp. NIES-4071]|nr:hypothetical protein NIES4071_98130 [Calothrix sp. NIES-4071]BAZ64077.1 hypothetical protein NIES4105_98060 [Calothrix sp. NIES-4105]